MGLKDRPLIDIEWLQDNQDAVVTIDVRSARDFSDLGHIPGSVNLPSDHFRDPSSVAEGMLPDPAAFADKLGELGIKETDHIVAYDGDNGADAARLLLTLAVYGHRGPLSLLDGGFDAWQARYDTTLTSGNRTPTTYSIEHREEWPYIVDRSAVESAVESDTIIVDTRTPAEYEQSHVPDAVQLGWEDVLTDDGLVKSEAELRSLLDTRGIRPDASIILYCNTARRLSHTFIILCHLGFEDVRFYEGSLTDWVRAESPDWSPFELQEQVRQHGPHGIEALIAATDDEVISRLKLVGLYHQKQSGYFMLRTKVPGGRLTAEQAAVIGEVAAEFATAPPEYGGESQNPVFGDRYLDITTRQDIQMHWIELADMPEIWDRYEAVGLTTLQACGNSVRNVVSCPVAGLDKNETMDVRPLVDRITERFLGDDKFANLPRKFKVSINACHENCARAQINDLAFTPAIKDGQDGFAVHVGGGLSDGPRAASPLDIFVKSDQVVPMVEGAADVFLNHGSYLDTAVNRLRYLVEEWGVDRFRNELERTMDTSFEPVDEELTTTYRGDHVGIHQQDDGRTYVGLAVPVGRMGGDEFHTLGNLAEAYCDGEVRLTPNQNILLPNIEDSALEAVLDHQILSKYRPDPGPFTRGIVTCTGREFCNYGIIETKNRAIRWANALDEWAESTGIADEVDVFRIHMSGCSASCAQPQIADVGLRGEVYRDDTKTCEAADVGLGGDLGSGEFVDWLLGKVPLEDIPPGVSAVITEYLEEKNPDETFADWSNRTSPAKLTKLLVDQDEEPPVISPGEV